MKPKNIKISKKIHIILIIIITLTIVITIFHTNISINYHKTRFTKSYSNNFERNFLGERQGMRGMMTRDLPVDHGAIGEVVSIDLPQVVISGKDKLEKTVLVSTTTQVRKFQADGSVSDIKIGDFLVV